MTEEIHHKYIELLQEHCIIPKIEIKELKPIYINLSCCGDIVLNEREGNYFCWNCGLVKDPTYILQEEPCNHVEGMPFGSGSCYTYIKYRPYKPLTHFREHLRRYLGQRFLPIPEGLIEALRPVVNPHDKKAYYVVKAEMKKLKREKYKVKIYDRQMRRWVDKIYKTQKFYKDIFTIIYALGGRAPDIKSPMQILKSFKDIQYQFLLEKSQGLNTRSNMPSHFMILDILLRKHDHEPYYEIPYLKDNRSREMVLDLFSHLNKNVREAHGHSEEHVQMQMVVPNPVLHFE